MEKTPENLDFLSSFIAVLLNRSGYTPTPQDCIDIDTAVKTATSLSDLALRPELGIWLHNWRNGGHYSYLFDNEVDNFSLSSFQVFELQGVPNSVIEPLFFYRIREEQGMEALTKGAAV